MLWSKKKISGKDYIKILLDVRGKRSRHLLGVFTKEFNYSGDGKKLEYEVIIFSLWLLILSLPPSKLEFRDQIHDGFSEEYSFSTQQKKVFYEDIDKRYRNYFEAYNMWQKNPAGGHMLGSVIVEILINQNPNFSLREYLPTVGAIEAVKAFTIFAESLKSNIKQIGEIEKRFKLCM